MRLERRRAIGAGQNPAAVEASDPIHLSSLILEVPKMVHRLGRYGSEAEALLLSHTRDILSSLAHTNRLMNSALARSKSRRSCGS